MHLNDYDSYIEICPPKEFNFEECLIFLGRSDQEVLHQIRDESVYKLLKVDKELILCKIGYVNNAIKVEFPISIPTSYARKKIGEYVWEWFGLSQNLEKFYQMAYQDKILQSLAHEYSGLRIIGIPDLFEALVWAIIGQQINLTFAYTLKKRFIEQFGEFLIFEGQKFWLFPSFKKIALLNIEDLKKFQFTTRKAEYIIDIAKAMAKGELSKEQLVQKKDFQQIHSSLLQFRGIGAWTADYVIMKCLHYPSAFPISDVGLHNALKNQLGLERKPTIEEIKEYAANWEGWQAYATFYLWRSLYDNEI
ncbi:DNA-3-methyladenine glycosylase family protein [Lysinibacillus telephonicus]|uniref:DNA-3-methyladenine glycosylase II n=1 Tax=Lysinibacillus telephonicus TaxID=1714840 RepID=A0A3S0JFT2_9BACI|nr:DNA-3-methyladenine glycosylase [Lysinibacillus telephonicus]RTQ86730.1 DNA-3-methyladenine glycosylase 2 family protein [Lysinibacillus telephonicus]